MVQVEEWEEVITEYRRIFTEIIEWCTETITIIRKKKAPRRYEDAGTGSISLPMIHWSLFPHFVTIFVTMLHFLCNLNIESVQLL